MDRKQELIDIIRTARDELAKMEDKKQLDINQQFVGKYFKIRNSYSSPQSGEYWWDYIHVFGIDESGTLLEWTFQRDVDGKIEIENDASYIHNENYIEITPAEFWEAWQDILDELNDIHAD